MLSVQEKTQLKMLYPDAQSHMDVNTDIENEMKQKLKSVKRTLQSDRQKLMHLGGYLAAPQYMASGSGGYIVAPQYDASPKKGGLIGITLAGLAGTALTAGVTGLASSFGRDIATHAYHHVAPTIERIFKKIRGKEDGSGYMMATAGKLPPSRVTLSNTTPLLYYRQLFKDVSSNLKHLGMSKADRKRYVMKMRHKLFSKKLNRKISAATGDAKEGGMHKQLSYRHIALPLIYERLHKNAKVGGKLVPAQKLTERAIEISKLIPKRKINMNENHIGHLSTCLKITGGNLHKWIPKEMKSTIPMRCKLKRAMREYACDLDLCDKRLSFKDVKDGAGMLTTLRNYGIPDEHVKIMEIMGDTITKKHFQGAGYIAPKLMAHLSMNKHDPRHILAIRKELKKLGSIENIQAALADEKSSLRTYMKYAGLSVLALSAIIGAYILHKKYRPEQSEKYIGAPTRAAMEFGRVTSKRGYEKGLEGYEKGQEVYEKGKEYGRAGKDWGKNTGSYVANWLSNIVIPGRFLGHAGSGASNISDKVLSSLDVNVSPKNKILIEQALMRYKHLSPSDIRKDINKKGSIWKKLGIGLGTGVILVVILAALGYGLHKKYGQKTVESVDPVRDPEGVSSELTTTKTIATAYPSRASHSTSRIIEGLSRLRKFLFGSSNAPTAPLAFTAPPAPTAPPKPGTGLTAKYASINALPSTTLGELDEKIMKMEKFASKHHGNMDSEMHKTVDQKIADLKEARQQYGSGRCGRGRGRKPKTMATKDDFFF